MNDVLKVIEPFITVAIWICFVVFACYTMRRLAKQRDAYKKRLDDLTNKSQLEQELSLATTEQLMQEIAGRFPGFVFLLPTTTNKQNESAMSIHIKGMPPAAAVMCMSMACQVINSGA